MREFIHPRPEEIQLTRVMHALSDPARLHVVLELLRQGNQAQECQTFLPEMPKATRSHHFKVLRESGVTRTQTQGTAHLTTLRLETLNDRFPGLLEMLKTQAGTAQT